MRVGVLSLNIGGACASAEVKPFLMRLDPQQGLFSKYYQSILKKIFETIETRGKRILVTQVYHGTDDCLTCLLHGKSS